MDEPEQHRTSRAWSWRHAIGVARLPANTKLVLHTLGLKMDSTGGSCYPPVSEIAELSGLDKKTVLKHLEIACAKGWIEISQHGYRGQRWKRNEYVAKWPGRDLTGEAARAGESEGGGAVPPPSSDGDAVEMLPEAGGNAAKKAVEQLHQDKNIPANIPNNISFEREREREAPEESQPEAASADDRPKTAAFQKRVMRFCSGRGFAAGSWKDWDASGSIDWVCRQFASLMPDERKEAERWRDAYLLDIAGRKASPQPPGVWLRDKVWTGLDPALLERAEKHRQGRVTPEERAQPDGWAKCLGPVGMARMFAEMLQGDGAGRAIRKPFISDSELRDAWPELWQFRALLRQKGGAVFGPRWHALKDAMEPVPQGTEKLASWKRLFADRGWLWLGEFDRVDVVFCPAGGPGALSAFEQAIRGNHDDASGREAAE